MRYAKRHTTLWGVVLVALAVGGCAKSAEGEKPTPAMLSEALPTITEMPGTWNETQRQVFETRSPENPSIDPSIWCPAAQEVTKNLVDFAGDSGADVEMESEGASGVVRLMRLQAWANDDVEAYFRDAREAVRICDGETVTDESGVVSTYSVVEGKDIGDESISWLQTTTPPVETQQDKRAFIGRTTIARFGSIMMVMQFGDVAMTGEGEAMAEQEWWSIVELAGKKLDTLDSQVRD